MEGLAISRKLRACSAELSSAFLGALLGMLPDVLLGAILGAILGVWLGMLLGALLGASPRLPRQLQPHFLALCNFSCL